MKNLTLFLVLSMVIIISANTTRAQDFIEAFNIGSYDYDEAYGMYVNAYGNIYLCGNFEGDVDFDPSSNEALISSESGYDGYLALYDKDGNYIWAISISGDDNIYCRNVIGDASGSVYMTGYFRGNADFDPSGQEFILTSGENTDGFLAKYDDNGNFLWAFSISSDFHNTCHGIDIDNDGNLTICGTFKGDIDFDPSGETHIVSDHGFMDAFIAQYRPSDGSLIRVGNIGGDPSVFYLPTVDCKSSGDTYFSGYFTDTIDIDPGAGINMVASAGQTDIFLIKLDGNWNSEWSHTFGSTGQDHAYDVYYDEGTVFITGIFDLSVDFDPSANEAVLTSAGDYDGFIAAYTIAGEYLWAKQIAGDNPKNINSLCIDNDNNIYIAGDYYGTVDFDPSLQTYELSSFDNWDLFVAKYDPDGNFEWASSAGGYLNDYSQHISLSLDQEEVLVCGKFQSSINFNPEGPNYELISEGGFDAFLAMYGAFSGASVHEGNNEVIDVFVYPNPAKETIQISSSTFGPDIQYRILNNIGLLIKEGQLVNEITNIDMSEFASGLYYLWVINEGQSIVRKVIVE